MTTQPEIKLPPEVSQTSAYLWLERRYGARVTDRLIAELIIADRAARAETVNQPETERHALLAGQEWISVEDRLPNDQDIVAFVVATGNNSFDYLNGRVLGGRFFAGRLGGFSVPGLTIWASHWMPLPTAPTQELTSDPISGDQS
ncbi:DUF551 domain-containing protein [Alcaligenaceae bacterium B3P038]|nr:DUF551 domain-containing protein [Alcaligenaceae bacterium B3P038]